MVLDGQIGMMRPTDWIALLLMLGTVSGCTSAEDVAGPIVELQDRNVWTESTEQNDPFADHRPAVTGCPAAAWITEREVLELSTVYCNYISINSPTLLDLRPGDELAIEAFHFDLTSPEPASGHWAIVIGKEIIWETGTSIPGPAQFFDETVRVTQSHPVGTPVTIHLHNHGQNSYGISGISLR